MSFMVNHKGERVTEIEKDYSDGRTKQSFKDSTDVNKIIKKAARTGSLSHLQKYEGQYGDFSDFDFLEAQNQLARAKTIFEDLPSEVRREFGNNPAAFFEFANNEENVGKLSKLFPKIAEPGDFFPAVQGRGAAASEPLASENTTANPPPAVAENTPPESPSGGETA